MDYSTVLFVLLSLLAAGTIAGPPAAVGQDAPAPRGAVVVDDFEGEARGAWPSKWRFLTSTDRAFKPLDAFMAEDERFYIVQEGGNNFLRAYTRDEAQRISLGNTDDFDLDWDFQTHPRIAWDWRARKLPAGAREDEVNDTAGALYVTFSTNWLGAPRSIKYTYSSTLPVGTVVSFGRQLKVIVAASGRDGFGEWVRVERDVVEDYKQVFGGKTPPERPLSITLWSDSDDTGQEAEVDFDNIVLLPPKQ